VVLVLGFGAVASSQAEVKLAVVRVLAPTQEAAAAVLEVTTGTTSTAATAVPVLLLSAIELHKETYGRHNKN
jgi:hypothetical protein